MPAWDDWPPRPIDITELKNGIDSRERTPYVRERKLPDEIREVRIVTDRSAMVIEYHQRDRWEKTEHLTGTGAEAMHKSLYLNDDWVNAHEYDAIGPESVDIEGDTVELDTDATIDMDDSDATIDMDDFSLTRD